MTFERARRLRRAGLRFRRQHPVGPYILDMSLLKAYLEERGESTARDARLAVEVDGAGHGFDGQAMHDARREEWLVGREIRVMRFAAPEILDAERRAAVLNMIADAAAPSTPLRAVPLPRDAEEDQAGGG